MRGTYTAREWYLIDFASGGGLVVDVESLLFDASLEELDRLLNVKLDSISNSFVEEDKKHVP
jgi:hypothetical protein